MENVTLTTDQPVKASRKDSIGAEIAAEAMTWVGTPFRHQGRIKGRAVDCANFVALVAIGVGLTGIEIPGDYHEREDGVEMLRLLHQYLELVDYDGDLSNIATGDIIALCDDVRQEPDVPRHLVIVHTVDAGYLYAVHATKTGVKRHRLDSRWLGRIHSVWRVIV